MTLFFVLIAFFAASTLAVRSHYEAQATIVEILNIRREALARSALSTGLAKLEGAGTEEGFLPFTLDGPGGLQAKVNLEPAGEDLLRLQARVEGGVGQAYLAQKVLKKRPQLIGVDVVHLLDGDLSTPDELKYRVVGSDEWISIPSEKTSLLWVKLDRRGNLFSSHFPALEGAPSPDLPEGFMERLVARNDELTRDGDIDQGFLKKASQALEENWQLDLNKPIEQGINAGYAGNAGNGNLAPQLETNPEFIRPARTVAKALSRGAEVDFQSQETGEWESIDLGLGSNFEGFPGKVASDGKAMFLPLLVPGEDRLRRFDLKAKSWSELPPPPALSESSGGGTKNLLQVEVDDDGNLYAHHGDDGVYGLSKYDAQKKSWSRLPSPPGTLVFPNGDSTQVMDKAVNWDGLSVGDQGEVYVLWRASEEPEVTEHLKSLASKPFTPGPAVTTGFPSTHPGQAGNAGQPGFASGAYGGHAGNAAYGGSATHGGNSGGAYGGISPYSPGGLGAPIAPPDPSLATQAVKPKIGSVPIANLNTGFKGNPSDSSSQGFPTIPGSNNFKAFLSPFFVPKLELIMQYKDGAWKSFLSPYLGASSTLGSLRAGIDGRILVHALNPSRVPDSISSLNGEGMVGPPELVPGLDGKPAAYFAVDSGAKRVLGKYTFRETADY